MKKISRYVKIVLIFLVYVLIINHFISKVFIPSFLPKNQTVVNDFASYYVGSQLLNDGDTPYRSSDGSKTIKLTDIEMKTWNINKSEIPAYIYPSFLAAIITPITNLSYPLAYQIWTTFCFLMFFAVIVLTFLLIRKKPRLDFVTLLIIGIYFMSMPTLETLTLGQVNYMIMFLTLGSFYFYFQKEQLLISSILLCFATLIKLSPLIFILYFIYKKEYKYLLYFCSFLFLSFTVLCFMFPSIDYMFFTEVLPDISSKPSLNNKSILVWVQYLFIPNDYITQLHNSIFWSKIITGVISLSFLILFFFKFFNKKASYESKYNIFNFCVLILLLLFIQPYLQVHHLVLSFFVFSYLLNLYNFQKDRIYQLFFLFLSFGFINSRGFNSFQKIGPYWFSVFLSNPQIYGILILLFLFIKEKSKHNNYIEGDLK